MHFKEYYGIDAFWNISASFNRHTQDKKYKQFPAIWRLRIIPSINKNERMIKICDEEITINFSPLDNDEQDGFYLLKKYAKDKSKTVHQLTQSSKNHAMMKMPKTHKT